MPQPSGADRYVYERHRPEETPLYRIVETHYPRFLARLEAEGGSLPAFVKREFDDYLKCGLLENGFLRVKCDACSHEHLVAFSCKRRGFCPSCGVPPPRLNLTRFHGVFAPNCKHRNSVVPKRKPNEEKPNKPLAPMTWTQRLKRVFAIDIETCPVCGGKHRVIACIEDPEVIARILDHVRQRDGTELPQQPRAPPTRCEHLDARSRKLVTDAGLNIA